VLLEITPDVFGRIELGRVRRKLRHIQLPLQPLQVIANLATAMDHSSVTNDQQFSRQMLLEMLQEIDHLRTSDRSRIGPGVEVPDRDPRNDRVFFPVEVKLQHGGLASGSPGAHAMGFLAQTTFVDKGQDAVFVQGHF
jgi:hypothetical protein